MSASTTYKQIVLAGNPNSGKSSLFNLLTGLNQKITNVPGTTIENKKGVFLSKKGKINIVDTPGTYSFNPKSLDEIEAVKLINNENPPDCLIYVADAANLKRNLYYFSQLSEMNIPIILVLNMVDVAMFKGLIIDTERLEKELGIRIFKLNARTGEGIDQIKEALTEEQFKPHFLFKNGEEDNHENRYKQIRISNDLSVLVYSEEKMDWVDFDEVSSGTKRQVLLAVRIAMAEQLAKNTGSEKQFLFLDEPFTYFDQERTKATLAALPKVSEVVCQTWIIAQEFPENPTVDKRIHCPETGNHILIA